MLLSVMILTITRVVVAYAELPLPPFPYPAPPQYEVKSIPIPDNSQLGMVISAHRHGVRTPIPAGNNSHCTVQGCGELTYNGKVMLANLGQYFATHYGVGGYGIDGTEPLNNGFGVIPTNAVTTTPLDASKFAINITRYDPRSARVTATSYDRTIQSGVGLVEGLYEAVNELNGCGPFNEGGVESLLHQRGGSECSTPADMVYPLIGNDPNDAMLYPTNTNPAFLAFQQAYNATMYPFMTNLTLQIFTPDVLLAMSRELSLTTGECDNNSSGTKPSAPLPGSKTYDPYSCALDLQDEMRYLYATNGAEWLAVTMPTVFANVERLDATLNLYCYFTIYGYDANIVANQTDTSGLAPISPNDVSSWTISEAAGYLAYPMAMSIITDMKTSQPTTTTNFTSSTTGSNINNNSFHPLISPQQAQDQGVLRYKDYSAHDMTIIELANVMGNYTNTAFDAPFAVTIFFEVWVTAAGPSEDPSTRHIRAFYGYPQQDATSNHTFSFGPHTLVCMSADPTPDGTRGIYAAPDGCPLADWERYIATRGPRSPAGICFISDETRALLNCGPEVVLQPSAAIVEDTFPTVEQLNRQLCYTYRQSCPQWACARNSDSDYDLIASAENPNTFNKFNAENAFDGVTDIPFSLDQLSNNCVRRFTSADANALNEKQDRIERLYKVIYIVSAIGGAVLVGLIGFITWHLLSPRCRMSKQQMRGGGGGSTLDDQSLLNERGG